MTRQERQRQRELEDERLAAESAAALARLKENAELQALRREADALRAPGEMFGDLPEAPPEEVQPSDRKEAAVVVVPLREGARPGSPKGPDGLAGDTGGSAEAEAAIRRQRLDPTYVTPRRGRSATLAAGTVVAAVIGLAAAALWVAATADDVTPPASAGTTMSGAVTATETEPPSASPAVASEDPPPVDTAAGPTTASVSAAPPQPPAPPATAKTTAVPAPPPKPVPSATSDVGALPDGDRGPLPD
jgi:hypothetical protein